MLYHYTSKKCEILTDLDIFVLPLMYFLLYIHFPWSIWFSGWRLSHEELLGLLISVIISSFQTWQLGVSAPQMTRASENGDWMGPECWEGAIKREGTILTASILIFLDLTMAIHNTSTCKMSRKHQNILLIVFVKIKVNLLQNIYLHPVLYKGPTFQ